jgi:endonuclease YncB( thermonuclease family)
MFRICSLLLLLTAPAGAQVFSGPARVVDGDTLVVSGVKVRLFGMDAPEARQQCQTAAGQPWACGTAATARLRQLASGQVSCRALDTDRYGRTVARCRALGRDLAADMVAEGVAFAYARYSQDYVALEAQARRERRGLWAGSAERPDVVRAEARPDSTPPGACRIKGNISGNGQLYHLPGTAGWAQTRIDLSKGERWFCTVAEAEAAGWQRAGH